MLNLISFSRPLSLIWLLVLTLTPFVCRQLLLSETRVSNLNSRPVFSNSAHGHHLTRTLLRQLDTQTQEFKFKNPRVAPCSSALAGLKTSAVNLAKTSSAPRAFLAVKAISPAFPVPLRV